MAETANPFIGESIFTEAIADIVAREGRTREGKVLYTDQTPNNEKYSRMLRHIVETQLPQYKQFVRVIDSTTGKPDRNGDVIEVDKALAGVFGFRLIEIKPKDALKYKLTDYVKNTANARKEFTAGPKSALRANAKPEDVIERFYVTNESLFKVQKQMKRDLNDAKTLGLSDDDRFDVFQDRNRKKDYNYLEAGEFQPYFPSNDLIDVFYRNAERTGQPNVFEQVESTLDRMYDSFFNLNFDDTWNLKLEDYLPKPQPQSRGPLPPQPQPNPAIVQQPTPMQTGLTPAEQALLSEEEKMIRLRNRGLT